MVNRLIGLSLPRKSVVRLNDRPNMTLATTQDNTPLYIQDQHFSQTRFFPYHL